jgi:hypothetical protein
MRRATQQRRARRQPPFNKHYFEGRIFMKHLARMTAGTGLAAAILLLFSACVTTLAPDYDQAIVDGLRSTNQKLMEFFASASPGTIQATAGDRVGSYNQMIGTLDALAIQARARPVPQNDVTAKVNEVLEKRGIDILDSDSAPSAVAMERISETMAKMRDVDKKQGVTAFEVRAFRGQVVIYLDQAITYETYLQR